METPILNLMGYGTGNICRPSGLLLVGSRGFIPDCNLAAIVHDLPHLTIHSMQTLAELHRDFDPSPVALLVHEHCIANATESDLALLAMYADCAIAIVVENAKRISEAVFPLLRSELAKGVLPMNLRLELWLLALRLLMRGGEFAPTSLLNSAATQSEPAERKPNEVVSTMPIDFASLTRRELQVLQMLSTGCPNRVIAERFSLSEHTVKVHVHNVIRKLAAKNRTAAAVMYLENPV